MTVCHNVEEPWFDSSKDFMNINIVISSCTISQGGITVELLVFYDRDSYLWHGPLQGYNALRTADKDSGAFNRSAYCYKNLHTAETSLLGGTVGRALASQQCVLGSNHGVDAIYGLSLLLVPFLALAGFSLNTAIFPSPKIKKNNTSNSIWNPQTRCSKFLRTPKCSVGKQITIYNFSRGCLMTG